MSAPKNNFDQLRKLQLGSGGGGGPGPSSSSQTLHHTNNNNPTDTKSKNFRFKPNAKIDQPSFRPHSSTMGTTPKATSAVDQQQHTSLSSSSITQTQRKPAPKRSSSEFQLDAGIGRISPRKKKPKQGGLEPIIIDEEMTSIPVVPPRAAAQGSSSSQSTTSSYFRPQPATASSAQSSNDEFSRYSTQDLTNMVNTIRVKLLENANLIIKVMMGEVMGEDVVLLQMLKKSMESRAAALDTEIARRSTSNSSEQSSSHRPLSRTHTPTMLHHQQPIFASTSTNASALSSRTAPMPSRTLLPPPSRSALVANQQHATKVAPKHHIDSGTGEEGEDKYWSCYDDEQTYSSIDPIVQGRATAGPLQPIENFNLVSPS
ncbi:hypothetical protein FRB95_014443 [Tulasnella sp. JGI-2019a]|nr:hypothetical protein FRB95_014443 [Tulasnella sp. JGI-2019a]